MGIKSNPIHHDPSRAVFILMALLFFLQVLGCATRSQTTHVRSTNDPADATVTTTSDDGTTRTTVRDNDEQVTTAKTTTTTETAGDGGIFGGVFHLLGEVLAFPFRVIGGVFDAIF
jgi:hypothetical protein